MALAHTIVPFLSTLLRSSRTSQFTRVALIGLSVACVWYALVSSGQGEPGGSPGAENGVVAIPSSIWSALERRAKAGPSQAATRRRQLRNFSIMRSAPERMPPSTGRHIESITGVPPSSLDLGSAQYAYSASGGIWLVNGRKITCMVQGRRGSLACATTADFAARGLVLGTAKAPKKDGGPPRSFRVLGIAPNWVDLVQVRIGIRKARSIPVVDHVYALHASVPIFVERFCGRPDQSCRSASIR